VDRLAGRTLRANARKRRRWPADWRRRGVAFAPSWPAPAGDGPQDDGNNPLRAFFHGRTQGRGIWKRDHYFDVYHRHFERFRGKHVDILEIGIYSGGSLDMRHEYFAPKCQGYAVDIERDQDDGTTIHNYPFAVLIEKRSAPLREFESPKRGTEWARYLRD
jgi:hypothetical protein